jgi:hypothetical protein
MTDPNLQQLLDRAAISDVVHAYATGLDRRDWTLFRSIFLDSIEMDFRSVGLRAGRYDADEWVRDAARLFAGFAATQHTSTNHVHDVRGDEATCTSNMQAEHFVRVAADPSELGAVDADSRNPDSRNTNYGAEPAAEADRWTIGGYYTNELVRTVTGWKLAKVALIVTWQTGNPNVSRIAFQRGRALERGGEAGGVGAR